MNSGSGGRLGRAGRRGGAGRGTTSRDAIAAVARRLVADGGAEAVSMRRVAAALGVTAMALYHHYPSRDALFADVVDREFAALAARMDAVAPSGPPRRRILLVLDLYLDYALSSPRVFDLVFARPRPSARRFPRDFRARQSPTLTRLADTVAAAMEKGVLRRADVWEVAVELWALAHGYVALHGAGRVASSGTELRALHRRAIRRLLDGLEA